ncbi:MAG: type III pantothenate kinase [Oscillospiraceae bacterium]|nr:type III pantothenate kinase [Oscillospiraceae bacterium]
MAVLAVGIGNTNIRAAVGGIPGTAERALPSAALTRAEDFISFAENAFGAGVWETLDGSVVCSVVPGKTPAVTDALEAMTGRAPLRADARAAARVSGLDISGYGGVLGEDRAVCCAAAMTKYGPPFVVVDFGTATTVNLVGAGGVFMGGAILAGVQTGLDALAGRTALLPDIRAGGSSCARPIGRDTGGCLLSGALIGAACAVEGYIRRAAAAAGLSGMPAVAVTGGHAPAVLPFCEFEYRHEPGLLTDGLLIIYRGN